VRARCKGVFLQGFVFILTCRLRAPWFLLPPAVVTALHIQGWRLASCNFGGSLTQRCWHLCPHTLEWPSLPPFHHLCLPFEAG